MNEDIEKCILAKRDELRKALASAYNELSLCPEGCIVCDRRGERTYYMWYTKDADGKVTRKRLGSRPGILKRLMRKKYLETEILLLEKDISKLTQLISKYEEPLTDNILKNIPMPYRQLPEELFFEAYKPLENLRRLDSTTKTASAILSLADRYQSSPEQTAETQPPIDISAWLSTPYEMSDYLSHERKHTTSHGLKVRSKAEVLISEKLYEFNVPFHYEEVLHIGLKTLVPDFTILTGCGNLFYWEHCGLMKDEAYRLHQKKKLELYENAGIVQWENLIVTYDDPTGGINLSIVESEIRNNLL